MLKRVLVTDGMDASAVEKLRADGYEVVEQFYEPDALGAALRDFDAVIIRSATKIKEPQIDDAKGGQLKLIIRAGVGVDNIAVKYAESAGIAVRNTPRASSNAVAELALALLFSCARNISIAGHTMRENKWEKKAYSKGFELEGKTMGVIGFGRIGQTEGRIAKAMGMKVLAYDLYPNDSGREIAEYVDLDALYARSDVITLHCNLTPENTCMINRDSIAKMKDGVILINNARGQLINEQDVADALNSGKMGAAGLDVVYTEPIRADNPLLQAKNCIITPHISWAPKESRQRIMDCAVSNVKAYLEGKPVNVVNLK